MEETNTYYDLDLDEDGQLVESSFEDMVQWLTEYLTNTGPNADPFTVVNVGKYLVRKKLESV